MLIYSKNRLIPTSINMMVLEGEDGAYYYVHRSLYEQAVILEDTYGENLTGLRLMVGGSRSRESAEYFFYHAPKPINVLGVYLELVEGQEDFGEDMEMMCGILHVMSSVLNFRKLLKIEAKVRASVRFSLSVREEYQLPWDRFFQEAMPYGTSYSRTPTYVAGDKLQEEVEDTEEANAEAEDLWAMLDEPIDFDAIEVPEAKTEEEEGTVEVAKEPEVPEDTSSVQSGLARLKGWA